MVAPSSVKCLSMKEGVSLETMRQLALMGRWHGKLNLCAFDGRWLLVLRHPKNGGRGWGDFDFDYYLKAEKSRRPRLFVTADAGLKVAKTIRSGVFVHLQDVGQTYRGGMGTGE